VTESLHEELVEVSHTSLFNAEVSADPENRVATIDLIQKLM
jgi:hypothetical protein